jgi:hypothetical protein
MLLDAIAMEAGVFCDIADVNPHPEFDPPICRNFRFPLGHSAIAQHGNFTGPRNQCKPREMY